MLYKNESERLKQAHILWRLAARHAAGDISQEEYERSFRVQIGMYARILGHSARAEPAGRKSPARNDERELCEA